MNSIPKNDLAAEFGAAIGLYKEASDRADQNGNNLGDAYEGYDEFIRQCMRIGREFEAWCCVHVDWEIGVDDCWPYFLEDHFGPVAIAAAGSECHLDRLGPKHWVKIARKLKLPLHRKSKRK